MSCSYYAKILLLVNVLSRKKSFKVHSFKNSCRNQIPDTMKHFGFRKIQLSLSIYDNFFFLQKTESMVHVSQYDRGVCHNNIRYVRMLHCFNQYTVRTYDILLWQKQGTWVWYTPLTKTRYVRMIHSFNKNTVHAYAILL